MLCNNQELQLIFHSLNTNPMLLNSVKKLMLTTQQTQQNYNSIPLQLPLSSQIRSDASENNASTVIPIPTSPQSQQ